MQFPGTLEKSDASVSRRRAASSAANLDALSDATNSRPRSSQHSRASSDLSLLRGFLPPSNDASQRQPPRSPRLEHPRQEQHTTPASGSTSGKEALAQTVSSMLRTPGIRLDAGGDTFLDVDESDADSYRYSDDIPILQRNDEGLGDQPARVTGVSFDELVDRLIAQKMSRADYNFADVFLCLYRKFAAPAQLFGALQARLERVKEDKGTHYLLKTETQLRIVEVIAKWVSLYPGDFARPPTRRKLDELIRHLSPEPIFAAAAHQMRVYLDLKVTEDDDTGWAESDDPEESARSDGAEKKASQRAGEISARVSSLQLDQCAEQRRPSQSSELSERGGKAPVKFQFHSYEDYEREAATMVPTTTYQLNKIRYRIFMDIDPDDIADEITRIDWVMFSSIRIRDFVRHVSLTQEQKEKCKSLKNVNRMINHFNHVAQWVANMVLIRDKAKHRAPCLEKFMLIAMKLRKLNNYNGLAAVLAGINSTAVHRLAQTRALVSPDVHKQFARLELLMGTQKSHFAYRLAWENSPLPRIPYIPLHRRDLVSAEEGSRTFVGPDGDRINWKKFEVLGEVLLPIMKSQGQPYPNLNRHEGSRELILDCRMMTDEEVRLRCCHAAQSVCIGANNGLQDIYQRSVQVESGPGGAADSSKKKFPWLAK